MPDTFPVIKWTEIDSALARAQSLTDLNSLRLRVETLQHLSKQSRQSLHTQNLITGYRLRIDRKRGEWLRDHVEQGGDRRSESRFPNGTLKSYGITKKESHILQRIASIAVDTFEKHIASRLSDGEELTTADMPGLKRRFGIGTERLRPSRKEPLTLSIAILHTNISLPTHT